VVAIQSSLQPTPYPPYVGKQQLYHFFSMSASHEAVISSPPPSKTMPFILDGSATSPPPASHSQDGGDFRHSSHSLNLSTSPATMSQRPHRTQSTTAISHLPVRLPTTVPEVESPVQEVHQTQPVASPRRPRASTGVSRTRMSAEQRPPEEDLTWWTEEIHKRREIRRRWKEAEDENTVIIGNKVDTNHPNYVTAYNMLTGLRVAVRSQVVEAG